MDEDRGCEEEEEGGAARSITVTGPAGAAAAAAFSPDLLEMYFENKKRSSGGPVVDVSVGPDHEARVTFQNVEDMRAVLRHTEHNLCGVPLRVRPCASLDSTKVLLLGLKPTTQMEVLQMYVEVLSRSGASDFALYHGAGRTAVLVHFHKVPPLGLKQFVRKCSERRLDGEQLRAERVLSSPRLWVGNLGPTVCQDLVTLYFESRQSDGDAVQDVTLSPSGDHAIITFCSAKVADQMLSQTHVLSNRHLEVKPYFPQLEEGPSEEAADGTTPSPTATPGSAPLPANGAAMESCAGSGGGKKDVRNGSAGPTEDGAALAEITESTVLKANHTYLLPLLQEVIGSMDNVYEGLKIAVSQNEIQITGTHRSAVMEAKCRLLTLLSEVIEIPCAVNDKTLAFLRKSEVSKYFRDVCHKSKINAAYRVTDSSVLIGSFGEESGNRLKEAITKRVHSFRLPLPPDQTVVTLTPEWSEFVKELEVTGPIHFECANDHVEVTTLRELEACVQAKVATFVREHAVVECVFPVEEAMLDYLQEHCSSILQQISEQMTLIPVVEPSVIGFKMYGTEVCCSNVREILQSLVFSLLCSTIPVPRPGIARLLCHHIGQELLSQTEQHFLCKIRPKGTSWPELQLLESHRKPTQRMGAGRREEEITPRFIRTENYDAGQVSARTSLPPDGADHEAVKTRMSTASSTESVEPSEGAERGSVQPHTTEGMHEEQADRLAALGEESNLTLSSASIQGDQQNISTGGDANTEEHEFEMARQLSLKHFQSNVTLNEEEQLQIAIRNSLQQEQQMQEQQMQNEEALLEEALQLSTQNLDKDNENILKLALSLSASETATPMVCEFERAVEMSMKTDTDHISLQSDISDNIELIVCVDASGSIDQIKDYLIKNIDGYYHEIKLENECFKKISSETKSTVEREHGVRLAIEGSSLSLYGCKVFTAEALGILNELLERAVQEQFDATEHDLIRRSVQWLWGAEPRVAEPYPPDAIIYLERAWKKRKDSVKVDFNGHMHTVDFNKMEELRDGSQRPVKIFRRELGRATEDESLASAECVTVVDLETDGMEFKTIKDQFLGSLENVNVEILQIQRVNNSVLYRQFLLKKQQIEHECSQPSCERTLFHGTAGAACSLINLHGFDRSFCGKNAALYGQGVYFAANACISALDQYSPPDSTGHKRVYVARVLTGDFAQGQQGMRTPPTRPVSADGNPALRFHSVVNSTHQPDIFVIFNDTQAYPEHLITFRWLSL